VADKSRNSLQTCCKFCNNKDLVGSLSFVILFFIVKMGLRENFHSLQQISTLNFLLIYVKIEHCSQNLWFSDLVSFKTHFNIILLPTPGYPTLCRLFKFFDYNFVSISLSAQAYYVFRLSCPPFDHPKVCGAMYK
jgi:hypothetical protein